MIPTAPPHPPRILAPRFALGWMMIVFLGAAPAEAGIDVQARTVTAGEEDQTSRMRIEGKQLRLDTPRPPSGQGKTSMVFDGTKKILRVVRHGDRSYVEIDESSARALAARVSEAQEKMRAHLDKLPAAQRETLEKMMKSGALPLPGSEKDAEPPPALHATPTGETETIDGKSCEVFELRRGDEKKGSACVASWDTVGIEAADLTVLSDLSEFQSQLSEAMGPSAISREGPFELLETIEGFPLRTRAVRGDAMVSETFFEEVRKTPLEEAVFAVPDGYQKKPVARSP